MKSLHEGPVLRAVAFRSELRVPRPAFRCGLALLIAVASLTASGSAQTLDVQPGRNFGWGLQAFGGSLTEAIAVGDVDNDGDWDVATANGGDGGPQQNQLHINQGGAQGGVQGDFLDATATRLPLAPIEASRDLEFADFDDDGDLDLFVANRGTTVTFGAVSRAFLNTGGAQHGAIGFFSEGTEDFWGSTLSVVPAEQIGAADDTGPWKGWSRDANFGDIDDDGDLDLMLVSPGPNMNGQRPTRMFLNDGTGTFDELFPWADDDADVEWHSVDADLADLDGDFDIDLFASSRDSQARVFLNMTADGLPLGRLFHDVTQTSLLDTNAALQGSNNYEVELADFDGEGDFDAWLINYDNPNGAGERILVNLGDGRFERGNRELIRDDPHLPGENDTDLVDFDGDGDLDVVQANFAGINRLYVSGVAQGLTIQDGLLHLAGAGGPMALAPQSELGANGNTGQSLDVDAVDLDGDGDPDLLFANDANQSNRVMFNELGVPDTHAPLFEAWTDLPDKSDGSASVVHVAVRDNSPPYVIAQHRASLIYSVDGGLEICVRLRDQGGQQFRGVIPAELEGSVSYRVEITDENGNTGISATRSFVQSQPGTTAIAEVGCGTSGVDGVPLFEVTGTLGPGNPTQFKLRRAAPNAFAVLFLALQSNPTPFKQGTLYPVPVDAFLNRSTDAGGLEIIELPWPAFPSGLELWLQYGVSDASVPGAGASLSNAVKLRAP